MKESGCVPPSVPPVFCSHFLAARTSSSVDGCDSSLLYALFLQAYMQDIHFSFFVIKPFNLTCLQSFSQSVFLHLQSFLSFYIFFFSFHFLSYFCSVAFFFLSALTHTHSYIFSLCFASCSTQTPGHHCLIETGASLQVGCCMWCIEERLHET